MKYIIGVILGAVVTLHAFAANAQLTTNLELYAKYDDSLVDATANGRNGTGYNTPTYAAGVINNGVDLESSGSMRVQHSATLGIDNVSAMSWSVWVKPESLADFRFILNKGAATNTSRTALSLGGTGAGANTAVLCTVANGTNSYGYTASSKLSNGVLAHIVMVFDGTQTGNANRLKCYINGAAETLTFSGTIPSTTPNKSSDELKVGADVSASNWDGIVDELGIWSRALTPSEVTSLYNAGAGLAYPLTTSVIDPLSTSIPGSSADPLTGTIPGL